MLSLDAVPPHKKIKTQNTMLQWCWPAGDSGVTAETSTVLSVCLSEWGSARQETVQQLERREAALDKLNLSGWRRKTPELNTRLMTNLLIRDKTEKRPQTSVSTLNLLLVI